MIAFEDTEEGFELRKKINRLESITANIGEDMLTDDSSDLWEDWHMFNEELKYAEKKYSHFKQEYEDNNKHYILGDFDE